MTDAAARVKEVGEPVLAEHVESAMRHVRRHDGPSTILLEAARAWSARDTESEPYVWWARYARASGNSR
ncbi:MAG: hypothetical protein H0X69_10030 [Gemmatimonadales bacterium]|nr:hypothetical protein [Gemmatimonadales bacterium]